MTTVVWKDGVVASDSRTTGGNSGMIYPDNAKKFDVSKKHGCVYMGAGNPATVAWLARVLENLDDLPWDAKGELLIEREIDDAEFVVITHDYRQFMFQTGTWFEMFGDCVALGSGSFAALAAMNLGFDAYAAIEAAIRIDSASGGDIHVFDMKDLKIGNTKSMFFSNPPVPSKRIDVTH
jgi:hypothetical protein